MAASPRTSEPAERYLIALGSNQRHWHHGLPPGVLRAASAALAEQGIIVAALSPIVASAPLGPSRRRFANAAATVCFVGDPAELLARLKQIELNFGRRRSGQRWAARVLDLDIVLWGGGAWSSPGLTVPHAAFRQRHFVLGPACTVAPFWRDPLTGLNLTQLYARLTRPRPLPRERAWRGPLAQSVEQLTFNQ